MATSGSYNFATSRTGIIEAALRKLQVLAEGQSANSTQLTNGAEALNFMLKAWAADGMPLWAIKYVYVYPIAGTNNVTISSSGGHASLELGATDLDGALSASDTSVTVSDGSGTANSDKIGIELDDGTIHWTTISSGGGTNTVVIASGVASAAADANRVWYYTTKAERCIQILDAWMVDPSDNTRTPINIVAEREIKNFGNLTSEARTISTISYVPLDYTGRLTFYPQWQDGKKYIELRAQYPNEDMDTASDEPAFPAEMWEAVVYQLAMRLIPEYPGADSETVKLVCQLAVHFKDQADGFIREQASLFFQPEKR